jgi:ABC-type transporter Mla subunit MlaD
MVLKDLSGIGALQGALETTNQLVADVLVELRRTNDDRLAQIASLLEDQAPR